MHPQPLIEIGNFRIYPYGICMALGILACFGFLMFTMWKKKFNEEATDKILFIGLFGTGFGIFSAMLFQATYNYIADPSRGFRLGESMTFIGGLIGGVLSFLGVYWLYIYVVAPRAKSKLLKNNMNATLTDALPFIPAGIAIAHAFGRLGCFFGGCCYGKPTDSWVGMYCAKSYDVSSGIVYMGEKVIPTQLFECIFLALLAAVMIILYFKFNFHYNFGLYAVTYGVWRFIIEYFRGDERGTLIPGVPLYPSQIWSIVMVLVGVGYFFLQYYVLSKHMKRPDLVKSAQTAEASEVMAVEAEEIPENGGSDNNGTEILSNAESGDKTAPEKDTEDNV